MLNPADCLEFDRTSSDHMMIDEIGDTTDDQPLSVSLNIDDSNEQIWFSAFQYVFYGCRNSTIDCYCF